MSTNGEILVNIKISNDKNRSVIRLVIKFKTLDEKIQDAD